MIARPLLLLAASLCLAAPAFAQDAAKPSTGVNFQAVLVDQDGKPLTDCTKVEQGPSGPRCADEVPLTLGRLALGALLAPEQGLDGTAQVKRWLLAQKVYKATFPVELNGEERDLLKAQIAKRGNPSWTGQAFSVLDPASAR